MRTIPRFYVFVTVTMTVIFGTGFVVAKTRLNAEEAALKDAKARLNAASGEVAELREELEYSQTDEFIENAARDELGMLFPGEYRYVGN